MISGVPKECIALVLGPHRTPFSLWAGTQGSAATLADNAHLKCDAHAVGLVQACIGCWHEQGA